MVYFLDDGWGKTPNEYFSKGCVLRSRPSTHRVIFLISTLTSILYVTSPLFAECKRAFLLSNAAMIYQALEDGVLSAYGEMERGTGRDTP